MELQKKKKICDEEELERIIKRIASQINERFPKASDLILIGIYTRGVYISHRIKKKIKELNGVDVKEGVLDITLYRDDLTKIAPNPVVKQSKLDFPIDDKAVVLVDDVLFTGRTVRAAIDALIDYGRPSKISLAVIVDRGHRELPIQADFIGKAIPTSLKEIVEVRLKEVDGEDGIWIMERKNDVK